MGTLQITGVDFLTNEICGLFQINTNDKNIYHRDIWCLFNIIQYRQSLDGFADQELCKRIYVEFENHTPNKLVISVLTEKILCITKNHYESIGVDHEEAHQLVWEKLYEHKTIRPGDFRE